MKGVLDKAKEVFGKHFTNETTISIEQTQEEMVEEDVEKYRLRVLAELKGRTSSASKEHGKKSE